MPMTRSCRHRGPTRRPGTRPASYRYDTLAPRARATTPRRRPAAAELHHHAVDRLEVTLDPAVPARLQQAEQASLAQLGDRVVGHAPGRLHGFGARADAGAEGARPRAQLVGGRFHG